MFSRAVGFLNRFCVCHLLYLTIFSGLLYGQAPTVIAGTDTVTSSRAVLNANFLSLYNQILALSGGTCTVTGTQTTGYLLTATDGTRGCSWQAPGATTIDADALRNAIGITDSGSVNHIIGSPVSAFPVAYAANQIVMVKAANTVTGATDINVASLGVKSVTKNGSAALAAGNIVSGRDYMLVYDGTQFQVLNPTVIAADIPNIAESQVTSLTTDLSTLTTAVATKQVSCTGSAAIGYVATATATGTLPTCSWQTVGGTSVDASTIANATYVTVAGTTNALTGSTTTAFPGYVAGRAISFLAAFTNTTAATINVQSLGVKSLTKQGSTALGAGDLVAGNLYVAVYDGTQFQVVSVLGPAGPAVTGSGIIGISENTGQGCLTATDCLIADASTHAILGSYNNDTPKRLTRAGADISTSDQVTSTHLTSALPAAQGGTGAVSPTAHGVVVAEGASAATTVVLGGDTALMGVASADPAGVAVPNCGDSSHALAYSTSTHTYSCQSVTGTAGSPSYPINPQTANYQVLAADFTSCKNITIASGTFTVTLVASGTQPTNGQCILITNYGTGIITVARSGQNINGGTTALTLPAGSATAPTGALITSNGTDYFAQLFGAGGGAGTPGGFSGTPQYNSSGTFGSIADVSYDGSHTQTLGASGIYDASLGQFKYGPQAPYFGANTADAICANSTGGTPACPAGGVNAGTTETPFAHFVTLPANTPAAGRALRWTVQFDAASTASPTSLYKVKACAFAFYNSTTGVCSSGGVTLLTGLAAAVATTSSAINPARYDCIFGTVTSGTMSVTCNNQGSIRGFSSLGATGNPTNVSSVPMGSQWVIYITTTYSAGTTGNWIALTGSIAEWVW